MAKKRTTKKTPLATDAKHPAAVTKRGECKETPDMYERVCKANLGAVAAMARRGLSLEEIATSIGVTRRSLHNWRLKHSELDDALVQNRDLADADVENALFRAATGFDVIETTTETDPDGRVAVKEKRYTQYNVTAQIFWLKNRQPAQWRDVHKQEVSGPDGGPIQSEARGVLINHEEAIRDYGDALRRAIAGSNGDTVSRAAQHKQVDSPQADA